MMTIYTKTFLVFLAWQQFIPTSVAQPGGEAVQIIQINQRSQQFELNDKALEGILLGPECRDKAVSVISIAGATRKGKSFLLNFLLKYLTANGAADWLGDRNVPLKGFSWRPGYQRDTTGILLWSKPFVVKQSNGRQVCVLLMDTQGAFDGKHTVAHTAAIFAISTMTSSVQVYNLFHNIQEDDLQHLELFTEYGQLALEQSGAKPFQKLLFLIRDFRYPDEFSYGLAGGEEFLGEKLQASDTSIKELTRVRANIRRVFESLDCFLMPYPGEKVASTKAFDGKLQDINEPFLKELQVLVPYLLRPENLEIKESNGQAVTGKQLMEYFRAYVKIFTSGGLPEPGSIWEATAEANHQAAASAARDHYLTNMNTAFGTNTPAVSPSVFDSKQAQVYKDAMAVYHGQKKLGSKEFGAPFLTKLEETLTNMASSYKNVNAGKLQAEKMAREAKETQLKIDALNEKYKEEQRKREEELKARTAMGLARDHYMTKIERQFGTATNYIDPKYLQQKHNEFLQEAEAIYRKEGGDISSAAIATFRQELNRVYQHNVQLNVLRKSVTDQKDSAASLKTQLERMNEQHEALLGELRELKSNQSSSGGFWKVLGGILGGAAMVAPFLG